MNFKYTSYKLLSRLGIETFKDIPGYEGLYQVSNLGRIKSLEKKIRCLNVQKKQKEKILKLHALNNIYLYIDLSNNTSRKRFLVHRLILLTFRGKSDLHVNHKDGNKQNNTLYNLEYCTRSENMKHAYKNGLMKNTIKNSNKNRKIKVKQYDKQNNYIREYNSIREASRITGITFSTIHSNINSNKISKGFIWKK